MEARFKVRTGGGIDMDRPYECDRMSMDFLKQRGYRPVTSAEYEKANIKSMENGFAVMMNSRGELRAIKEVA